LRFRSGADRSPAEWRQDSGGGAVDVSIAFELARFGRSLGIVAVFTVLGPLVIASIFAIVVLVLGLSFLQLVLSLVSLEVLRPWLSIAGVLLLVFTLVAAVPPAFAAGLAFAVASVYFGANALRVALLVAAIASIGIVVMGFLVSVSEAAPVLLPNVQGVVQACALAVFLTIPALTAASLCWFVSRPLHRSA
jgi:hypothetical protein